MEEYSFGGLLLRWDDGGCHLLPGGIAGRFRNTGGPSGESITLTAQFQDLESLPHSCCIQRGSVFDRYELDGEPLLVYHWGHLTNAFAIAPQRIGPEGGPCCLFDPMMRRQVPMPFDWFLGVSGLHRALLLRDAVIFHAAYIEYQGEAILFAAPSQTGKSTQAELWRQYAGAEIVNGDRVLLRCLDGRWHACGYPCAGSSGICLDRTLPLRSIVVLTQSPLDLVQPMSPRQQVTALATGMQIYPWDSEELDRSFRLAQEIVRDVPVFRLNCTPTQNAVEVLRHYLEVNDLAHPL